jgi:3-hydroxyisobutyrate dehydrogenase-like beta-hydroxyacid dehydrogenase
VERSEINTVGILYSGEMGSALGRVFAESGCRVVTTLQGRSPRTQRLCRDAGLEALDSLGEVVRLAEMVVSVVPPSAAIQVAKEYAEQTAAHDVKVTSGDRRRLYVDANAISPATIEEIDKILAPVGIDFVDVAINGLAAVLRTDAIVYLSGSRASELARLVQPALRVQIVGDTPGKASALKGALAGLSKGVTALFIEIAVVARAAGVSESFLERCRDYYPGVMEVVDRMLPSYPRHARRRAEEMKELNEAIQRLGLRPDMVRAAEQVTRATAEVDWEKRKVARDWTTESVLEVLHDSGLF